MNEKIVYVVTSSLGYTGKLKSKRYSSAMSAQKYIDKLRRSHYMLGSKISAYKVYVIDDRAYKTVELCNLTMGIVDFVSHPSPRVINRYYNISKIVD